MKNFIAALLLVAMVSMAAADIQNPPRPGPTRKLARGIANVVFSGTYIVDSWFTTLQKEGPTEAATFGIIEGTSKTLNSIGIGAYEVLTFPKPVYEPVIAAYDYPPADLENFY